MEESPLDCVFFTLIVDDIVLPDGRTLMAQLGGGGPQSIFGYQVASVGPLASVALSAGIGRDVPPDCLHWLTERGVIADGLQRGEHATPRAWQLFEADGRRTQVWRTQYADARLYATLLLPPFTSMPARLKSARAYHVGVHPERFDLAFLTALKRDTELAGRAGAAGAPSPWLSVETFTAAAHQVPTQRLEALFSVCDVFSPNELEAVSMVGHAAPEDLVERFLDLGARVVVLRMGAEGALVTSRDADKIVHVPAAPGDVVDVTGCGNAFNGSLLAALQRGEPLETAASWASAAASLMAGAEGVPRARIEELRPVARERCGVVRQQCRSMHKRAHWKMR